MVAEGEKQEKGRRRGKAEKIPHAVDEQRHKHQRERDRKPGQHQFLKIILQASYSSSLNQKTFREL